MEPAEGAFAQPGETEIDLTDILSEKIGPLRDYKTIKFIEYGPSILVVDARNEKCITKALIEFLEDGTVELSKVITMCVADPKTICFHETSNSYHPFVFFATVFGATVTFPRNDDDLEIPPIPTHGYVASSGIKIISGSFTDFEHVDLEVWVNVFEVGKAS